MKSLKRNELLGLICLAPFAVLVICIIVGNLLQALEGDKGSQIMFVVAASVGLAIVGMKLFSRR